MSTRSNPVLELLPIAERAGYGPPPGECWAPRCNPAGLRNIAYRMRADGRAALAEAFETFARGLEVSGRAMDLPPGDGRLPGLYEGQRLYDKAVTLGKAAELTS